MAAALSASPAWASHATAALLWGWEVRHGRIELTMGRDRGVKRADVRIHSTARLSVDDVGTVRGVPVTSPARTLLDLAGRTPVAALGTSLDDALARRLVTLETLASIIPNQGGARWNRPSQLAELVRQRQEVGTVESPLEARVLRVLMASGLPLPVCQYEVVIGGRRYRLDFAWPPMWAYAEADGFKHHRGRRPFDRDRSRGNALAGAGWTGVHLTSAFTDEVIVADVARLLQRAARRQDPRRIAAG